MPRIASNCCRCLLALALGLAPIGAVMAAPVFAVSAPVMAGFGQTIEVDVVAQSLSDLYDYQFDLTYDPAHFHFVSDSEGPFLATAGATFFSGGSATPGSIQFLFDTLIGPGPGATGTGILARFSFTGIGIGASTFALSNVLAQNTPGSLINVGLTSARVTVPEPGTIALLSVALLGCMVSMRKRDSQRR
jgi:hypothetical protein